MKKFQSVSMLVLAVTAVTMVTTAQLKLFFANENVSVSIYVGARGARCDRGARGARGDHCTIEASFC